MRWAETGEEEKGFGAHNALDYKYVRQKTKEKLLKRTIWAFETLKNSLFWTKSALLSLSLFSTSSFLFEFVLPFKVRTLCPQWQFPFVALGP